MVGVPGACSGQTALDAGAITCGEGVRTMPNPVVHWEIAAKDAAKLQRFYSTLFAWDVCFRNPANDDGDASPDYGLVESVGEGINGGIFQADGEVPPHLTFYVQIDDIKAYLEKAERLGGKTVTPPALLPAEISHIKPD